MQKILIYYTKMQKFGVKTYLSWTYLVQNSLDLPLPVLAVLEV